MGTDTHSIVSKVEALKEYESLLEDTKTIVESLKDELKNELTDRGVEQLEAGPYVLRFTSVLSSRFDTKRFKEVLGEDLYKTFTKEVASKRFMVA